MENATKALIIAAAILIAIVLISIGVFVLRQGQDAMKSADMSEAQIMAFNSKFETYSGTQRGSQVNALLDRVIASNREQQAQVASTDTSAYVEATHTTASGAPTTIIAKTAPTTLADTNKAQSAAYYVVTITKDPKTGIVTKVDFKDMQ